MPLTTLGTHLLLHSKLPVCMLADNEENFAPNMDYAQARQYAQLYSLQQMFNADMDRYVDSRAEMYAFLSQMQLQDKPSEAGFEAEEHTKFCTLRRGLMPQ